MPAPDTIRAGAGDDFFFAEPGEDRLDGQAGTDQLIYVEGAWVGVDLRVNLSAGFARARGVDQVEGIETVYGNDGDDVLIGNEEPNLLLGEGGDDVIRGLGGDDHLHGESNDDRLEGGPGNDLIEGGHAFDLLFGGSGNDEIHATGFDPFDHDYYAEEDFPNELYGGAGRRRSAWEQRE